MARPRTEAPDVKRTRILDAARAVLIEKGYTDFRMSDVAKQADIAAGTLYLYFSDKVGIYAAVFIDLLDRLDQRFLTITARFSGMKALRKMAEESLTFIDEHQDFLSQCTGEHPALIQSAVGQKIKNRFKQHLAIITKTLSECIKEGSIRDGDIVLMGMHFSFVVRMFMIKKILENSKTPLRYKAKEMIHLFLNGVGA